MVVRELLKSVYTIGQKNNVHELRKSTSKKFQVKSQDYTHHSVQLHTPNTALDYKQKSG